MLPMPRVRPSGEDGRPVVPASGGRGALRDRFGRVASDLRISLTDRCNLRCTYCMPAEGLDWMPQEQVLSDAEVVRLVRVGVERLGITTVRLTGGEPLLRRDLEQLVADLAVLEPRPVIALTTNGIGLARRAAGLGEAGLDPVKVNTVLMRGLNDDEAVPLLRWAMAEGVQLRFIEQMPLDAQHAWQRSTMVTAAEIWDRLNAYVPLVEDPADVLARGSAPAELFRVAATGHRVGIIAAVSKPFCGSCDRVRLT